MTQLLAARRSVWEPAFIRYLARSRPRPATASRVSSARSSTVPGPSSHPQTFGLVNAHNQDIDNVTIRNLVIRDSSEQGIHAYTNFSDGWVIDHNEVTGNKSGVQIGNFTTVSANTIHHNVGNSSSSKPADRGGGYGGYLQHDNLWVNNEIAYNGPEQKFVGSARVTFRGNVVHHNEADGIWYDFDNVGVVIENNIVNDNGRMGIDHECNQSRAIIRNNRSARNATADVFISCSSNTEVYGNTIRLRRLGVWMFIDVNRGYDLANNSRPRQLFQGLDRGASRRVPVQ